MSTRGQVLRIQIRLQPACLKELAARRNETIEDLAKAADIDRDHLYRLLRGEHSPTPSTRRKLLEHFDVSFDELFVIVHSPGANETERS